MLDATVVRTDTGGWLFSWTGGSSPYSLWLDGKLLATVVGTTYDFETYGYASQPPDIEILGNGQVSQSQANPPYIVVQWRGVQSAVGYVVEQLISAVWTPVANVRESGKGYYTYASAPLQDATTFQFRVRAVDLQGNSGAAITFTFEECRNPPYPVVDVDIDGSNNITVSAS